ncbi:DUF4123 domain-containing protein [Marinobacter mobilis]|uniref:DUF4123 domain-containing protein n=1 Tax=Marinobacter mobilis TaxID=488533 RepID=A0A1H3DRT7_9GAMM|nr:DUF4123 domain-containing protein [Marinobacter mobilis]SDX69233.1 protein of unknown function [Marinobacter mobilis]
MRQFALSEAASSHAFDDSLNWYAILEGADPGYDTLQLIYASIPSPEWLSIYQGGPYTELVKVSPVLLKLDQPDSWIRHWRTDFPGLAGSLLGSEQDLAGVGHHLRTLVSVRVREGADAMFRFHDAWIMSAMYPELSVAERAKLHGPITKWLWLLDDKAVLGEVGIKHSSDIEQLEDGWLHLDNVKLDAIRQGLAAKRNWKDTHA